MLDKAHELVIWMKKQAADRDARMNTQILVRAGELQEVDPEGFNERFGAPVVANFIANAAEDFANAVAPLPALNCAAGSMRTERDKRRAAKKNKGADAYWRASRLERTMITAADQYDSYGFTPFYVEPNFEAKGPHIFVEDAVGAYYLKDRYGRVTHFAKCTREPRGKLMAMFPDVPGLALGEYGQTASPDEELEVIRYCDDEVVLLYVCAAKDQMVLAQYANKIGVCPVSVAERHSLDGKNRGRYDDAVGPQLARNRMRMLVEEAAEKSIHAPMWVDPSVMELPTGADAIISSDQPPQRVSMSIPQDVFAAESQMQEEVRIATKHPSARDGMSNASVVTGRGVEALLGAFDGQIKAAQIMLGEALAEATELAFRIDQAYFGKQSREIQGTLSGESYAEVWEPNKDIDGNFTCSVDYGFAAGQGQPQAMVLMLQLMGAGLISRDTVRRNSPIQIDVATEQRHIETEKLQDALLQGFEQLAAAMPQMAAQGMDVSVPIHQLSEVIRMRSSGKSLEEAAAEVFKPPEPAPEAAPEAAPAPGAPAGPAADAGPPDLMNLIAGLRNGQVVTGANIQRSTPV